MNTGMKTILTAEELHQHFPNIIRSAAMANIMAKQGRIPFLMFGRRRFFCLESINKHFLDLEQQSFIKTDSSSGVDELGSNTQNFGVLRKIK